MILLAAFWPGLAIAAALGLIVGGVAGWPTRPVVPLALCGAAGLLAGGATTGLASGLPGLWLECAALLLPTYVAGCAMGAMLKWAAARG